MCIFARGKTTLEWWLFTTICCELLSNVYLCKRKNNLKITSPLSTSVVNCFQMCIFARGKTTASHSIATEWRLWIAFKCVSLQEEKQRIKCDYRRCWVVNCFQMCIFARGKTTRLITWTVITWLWIAFKCVSLQEEKQQADELTEEEISCELLSNVYLCKRKNN